MNARDLQTLTGLAIAVADGLPLPDLITSAGRRIEVADFCDFAAQSNERAPRSIVCLLALPDASTVSQAATAIRNHAARAGLRRAA